MKIVEYPLTDGQWYREIFPKKYIVWHATEGRTAFTPYNGKPGRATSSIDYWNNNKSKVGAPFLIDRDGTIYQTFDEKDWISHLGIKGSNSCYDKHSIAIEIANEGPLKIKDNKFYAFDKNIPNTQYIGEVLTLEKQWRGSIYYAKLSLPQIKACIELTIYLCKKYKFKPKFFKPSTKFDYPNCFKSTTIICHSNCRIDKQDLFLEGWVYEEIKKAGIPWVSTRKRKE